MANKNLREQIHAIQLKLGSSLFNASLKTLQGLFIANRTELSQPQMRAILQTKAGLAGVSLYDKKYYIVDWEVWEKIIDKFFIDQMIYKYDYLDCDNFAFLFTSIASLMGLNSSGVVTGDVLDLRNNRTFRHAFNFIVYKNGSDIQVRCYEPQTDDDAIVNADFVVLNRMVWKYKFNWGIFY